MYTGCKGASSGILGMNRHPVLHRQAGACSLRQVAQQRERRLLAALSTLRQLPAQPLQQRLL